MKGYGKGVSTLIKKLYFWLIPTSTGSTNFIYKHSSDFKSIGSGVKWQPRLYPSDPELISIGNNVKIAANVSFINHDIISELLNEKFQTSLFEKYEDCIFVGNNVMIGSGVRILPGVKIGSNVIIGAGSIVTKDIPDNSVAAGIPCKVVGDFNTLVEKCKKIKHLSTDELWSNFNLKHM